MVYFDPFSQLLNFIVSFLINSILVRGPHSLAISIISKRVELLEFEMK